MEHTFKKNDLVIIKMVDYWGFNGRENERHPKPRDVGTVGQVVRVEDVFGENYTCVTILTYEKEPRFLDMMDSMISAELPWIGIDLDQR